MSTVKTGNPCLQCLGTADLPPSAQTAALLLMFCGERRHVEPLAPGARQIPATITDFRRMTRRSWIMRPRALISPFLHPHLPSFRLRRKKAWASVQAGS
jgi:hypothetical protein